VATTKGGKHSCRAVKYRSTLSRAAGLDVGKCGEKRGKFERGERGWLLHTADIQIRGRRRGKASPKETSQAIPASE